MDLIHRFFLLLQVSSHMTVFHLPAAALNILGPTVNSSVACARDGFSDTNQRRFKRTSSLCQSKAWDREVDVYATSQHPVLTDVGNREGWVSRKQSL